MNGPDIHEMAQSCVRKEIYIFLTTEAVLPLSKVIKYSMTNGMCDCFSVEVRVHGFGCSLLTNVDRVCFSTHFTVLA